MLWFSRRKEMQGNCSNPVLDSLVSVKYCTKFSSKSCFFSFCISQMRKDKEMWTAHKRREVPSALHSGWDYQLCSLKGLHQVHQCPGPSITAVRSSQRAVPGTPPEERRQSKHETDSSEGWNTEGSAFGIALSADTCRSLTPFCPFTHSEQTSGLTDTHHAAKRPCSVPRSQALISVSRPAGCVIRFQFDTPISKCYSSDVSLWRMSRHCRERRAESITVCLTTLTLHRDGGQQQPFWIPTTYPTGESHSKNSEGAEASCPCLIAERGEEDGLDSKSHARRQNAVQLSLKHAGSSCN